MFYPVECPYIHLVIIVKWNGKEHRWPTIESCPYDQLFTVHFYVDYCQLVVSICIDSILSGLVIQQLKRIKFASSNATKIQHKSNTTFVEPACSWFAKILQWDTGQWAIILPRSLYVRFDTATLCIRKFSNNKIIQNCSNTYVTIKWIATINRTAFLRNPTSQFPSCTATTTLFS